MTPEAQETTQTAAEPRTTGRACNCLNIIRGKLAAHHKVEPLQIDLALKQTIDTETLSIGSDLPPLYYTFPIKTGRRTTRKRSYVVFAFCPFCGKRQTN